MPFLCTSSSESIRLTRFVDSLAGDQLHDLAAESSQQQRIEAAEGLYSVYPLVGMCGFRWKLEQFSTEVRHF